MNKCLLNLCICTISDVTEEHYGTARIEGRNIINFHFADDTNDLAYKMEELVSLVKKLDKTSSIYDIRITTVKQSMTK